MPYVDGMEPAGPQAAPASVRTGLVVLTALLSEVIVIAAACNQWVAVRIGDQLQRSLISGGSATARDFKATLLVFNWRFVPRAGDADHVWLAQVFMILTLVLLSAALIRLIGAGPARFARVFFAVWTSVVFATLIASYVRGFVNQANASRSPRITQALFEGLGPTTVAVMAGMILGLVTGLVAAIVAVNTRRRAPAAVPEPSRESPYIPPEQPPPFFGESVVRPWPTEPTGTAPTTRLPAVATSPPSRDQPTTRLGEAGRAGEAEQPTARFPRPPDDDDLGHV
jgi:hypothetical protein